MLEGEGSCSYCDNDGVITSSLCINEAEEDYEVLLRGIVKLEPLFGSK